MFNTSIYQPVCQSTLHACVCVYALWAYICIHAHTHTHIHRNSPSKRTFKSQDIQHFNTQHLLLTTHTNALKKTLKQKRERFQAT